MQYYSGVDDKVLKQLAAASLKTMAEAKLNYQAVTFLFLPEETEALKAALCQAEEQVSCDEAAILPARQFTEFIAALDKAKRAWSVMNHAVGMDLILRIFWAHVGDLAEGWVNEDEKKKARKVPIESALGAHDISLDAARTLKKAMDKARATGSAEPLAAMATYYLETHPA